ncbi:hypothetical protein ACOYR1_06930 [Thalassotalea piscium]
MIIKFLTVCTFVFSLVGCSYSESETDQANRLAKVYKIEIKAGDPTLFYPQGFAKHDAQLLNVKLTKTSLAEASETLDGIEDALAIYPQGFVASVIDAIYISGPIFIEGAEAGGTYGTKWIILSNISKWNGTQANYENALHGVHHEMSSLIFNHSSFAQFAWQSLLAKGWKPAPSNYNALSRDNDLPPDYEAGFLSEYGKTSMGNDFNVYAEFAFAEPERLKQLAKKHPVIAKKLSVFISAYSSFSSKFENDFHTYFTQTGLNDVAIKPKEVEMMLNIDVSGVNPQLQ